MGKGSQRRPGENSELFRQNFPFPDPRRQVPAKDPEPVKEPPRKRCPDLPPSKAFGWSNW